MSQTTYGYHLGGQPILLLLFLIPTYSVLMSTLVIGIITFEQEELNNGKH